MQYEKQKAFLSLHFSPNLVVQSENLGYLALLQQWEAYTRLHSSFHVERISIEKLDQEGDVIRLNTVISLIVTHRMIVLLYPHMSLNLQFLQAVVGKPLHFNGAQTFRFGKNNQVSSYYGEYDMAQGWLQLLENPTMLSRVLRQKTIENYCITVDATEA